MYTRTKQQRECLRDNDAEARVLGVQHSRLAHFAGGSSHDSIDREAVTSTSADAQAETAASWCGYSREGDGSEHLLVVSHWVVIIVTDNRQQQHLRSYSLSLSLSKLMQINND